MPEHRQHDHDHAHHTHAVADNPSRIFTLAISLNAVFVAIEFGYGWAANSTALMADASHNLSDILGLLMAWLAWRLSRQVPNDRYTFGLHSSTILAALANAVLILVASGAIAWEAITRFMDPQPQEAITVTLVAAAGIVVNGFSAWLFVKGSKNDLNLRGAYIHMASDAAVSMGVVVSGLLMMQTNWPWIDPAISLVIVAVIVGSTWGLLKESVRLALHAVPAPLELAQVQAHLLSLPGVAAIHHLHVWGISTKDIALSVHLVMPGGYPGDAVMDSFAASLSDKFNIRHSTLQYAQGPRDQACILEAS